MEQHGSKHIDPRILIQQGDITLLKVDAIVNAANNSLLGGGGVDGAIHRAAGPQLREYNKTLGGCDTGDAKISPGFKLAARFVISTVGPVWQGGKYQEDELLAHCYTKSLQLAVDHNIKSIAFPSISTGVYGFPFDRAGNIAIETVNNFLNERLEIEKVILITFSDNDYHNLQMIYNKIAK